MTRTNDEAHSGQPRMLRPAVLTSVLSVVAAWLLVLVEPSDADGASVILMMFGVPSLCVAVLCLVLMTGARAKSAFSGDRRWLWWPLCVMPVGVLGALLVNVLRHPDYFIGAESPWMLLWLLVFVGAAMLSGILVAAFWLGPIVALVVTVKSIILRQAGPSALIGPLAWLAVGALVFIGGRSVAAEGVGRFAYGNIIAAFFGLPGAYVITWMPGLWIVRGIVLALLLTFGIPMWRERRAERAQRV
ncbi:hypothetical protein [Microbacterium sp. NPDC057650]|uniref:hypothetical protein n=1 Tax=unclassified Microbacterium TaxID=2609290 RepID=UPI00366AD341